MKTTLKALILTTLLIVLAVAPAQAQVLISTFPAPEDDRIVVSGQLFASSNLTATTLTLTFPGPIFDTGIQVENDTGLFFNSVTVDHIPPSNVIEVFLPGRTINTTTGSFHLTGITLSAETCSDVTLELDSIANNYRLASSTLCAPPSGSDVRGSLLFLTVGSTAPAGYTFIGQQDLILASERQLPEQSRGRGQPGGATVLRVDVYVKD